MNSRPLAEAMDADLRLSLVALERAAQRAREIAAQTGTELIFSHQGVLERVRPEKEPVRGQIHEPPAPYDKAP